VKVTLKLQEDQKMSSPETSKRTKTGAIMASIGGGLIVAFGVVFFIALITAPNIYWVDDFETQSINVDGGWKIQNINNNFTYPIVGGFAHISVDNAGYQKFSIYKSLGQSQSDYYIEIKWNVSATAQTTSKLTLTTENKNESVVSIYLDNPGSWYIYWLNSSDQNEIYDTSAQWNSTTIKLSFSVQELKLSVSITNSDDLSQSQNKDVTNISKKSSEIKFIMLEFIMNSSSVTMSQADWFLDYLKFQPTMQTSTELIIVNFAVIFVLGGIILFGAYLLWMGKYRRGGLICIIAGLAGLFLLPALILFLIGDLLSLIGGLYIYWISRPKRQVETSEAEKLPESEASKR
jgi:hypothetical protein